MFNRQEVEVIQMAHYNQPQGDYHNEKPMELAMQRLRARIALDLFGQCPGPIVDLGCGEGNVVRALRQSGVRAFGLDLAFERLRENGSLSEVSICGRGQELPFPDDSIGGICAFELFEHLTSDDAILLLQECKRVLVPGDKVALTTCNANCLARRLRRLVEPGHVAARKDHVNEVGLPFLLECFDRVDFTNIRFWGIGFLPGMRRIQALFPFPEIQDANLRLGRNLPGIAPEVLVIAEKPN